MESENVLKLLVQRIVMHCDITLSKANNETFLCRFKVLRNADGKEHIDGLNSLKYVVKDRQNHQFHTMISVDLLKEAD